MRITFVGGGNMANALIGGLLARGAHPGAIHVIDPSLEQRSTLAARHAVHVLEAPSAAAFDCDVVLLAVKPQQMREAARSIAPLLDDPLVISVAAGLRIADLQRWLGATTRIVRAMPNTPALIGAGITGLVAGPGVQPDDREIAESVVRATGQTLWVADETMLDAVTAISGSGPAYVFLFMEALESAACELGLDPGQARTLALATFGGAAQLAERSSDPPAVLRERVTSKGGTTAAALEVMRSAGVPAAIAAGAHAAFVRAGELADEFGRAPPGA